MKGILTKVLSYKSALLNGNNSYNFHNTNHNLNNRRIANKLIRHFFQSVLASKPKYTITTSKVIINVFYYISDSKLSLNINRTNHLGDRLSRIYNRPVELRLVKLYYPYLNRYILAQLIRLSPNKFTQIFSKLLKNTTIVKNNKSLFSPLPLLIIGLKVEISGRLESERSKPRMTVQTARFGSLTKDKNTITDYRSFTTKNLKGAYTIKV